MGGAKEGITTIEVDFIVVEMVTKRVTPNTTEITIKKLPLSTWSTIVETEKGTKNLQPRDGTQVVPMVK